MSFSVVVRHGVPYLGLLMIDGPYSCEDGTQGDIAGGGWGWFPSDLAGPVPTNEPLELSENWGDFAFMLSGRLGPLRGSGTLTVLIAALTADEQAAQVCTFGGTWSVERSGTSFSLEPTMTVEAAGGRTLSDGLQGGWLPGLDHTRPNGNRTDPPLPGRHHAGHRHGVADEPDRHGHRPALHDRGIPAPMRGRDRDLGGHLRAYFFDATQVMPPGRLDLDIVPDALPVGIALHVHGELDPHLGSGTVSMIWPWLTEDLEAQRCQTGEQTWRLWRTDAGY